MPHLNSCIVDASESCKARNYIEIDYVCYNSMPEAFAGSSIR